jgi:SET domain-containing protein
VNKIVSSGKIYISESKIPKAGRGVFASVDIKRGETIEQCPVIEIPEHDASNINNSILVTYIYYLGENKDRMLLSLGFGSIYNHSDQPNAEYKEEHKNMAIDFIALNTIKKDEEITVNYNQGYQKDKSPLWFTVST